MNVLSSLEIDKDHTSKVDPDYLDFNLDEYLDEENPDLKNVHVSPR